MISMPQYTKCRLCSSGAKLCDSHVFPKFYWEWLKQTGGDYFRDPRQPNRRLQDGPKLPMLCLDCEERFSKRETPFASQVFRFLMVDSSREVVYKEFALPFLISVLWRNLAIDLDRKASIPDEVRRSLEDVDREWGQFLLGECELTHYGRVHMICAEFLIDPAPPYNRYLTRDAHATPMWKDPDRLIGYYAKFAKIIVFAELTPIDEALWVNTLVTADGGHFRPGSIKISDPSFGQFVHDQALMYEDYRSKGVKELSPKQLEKITKNFVDRGPSIADSQLMQALQRDSAWSASIPRVGRNEPCPCGSGRKHKKCHGA